LLLIVPIIFISVCYAWVQAIPLFRWLMFVWLLIVGLAIATLPFNHVNEAMEIITVPLAIAAAWIIASIPTYRERWKDRADERRWEEERKRDLGVPFDARVLRAGRWYRPPSRLGRS
jgi:hypothetical protein